MISFLTKGGMGSGCVCCGQRDFIDQNRQSNGDDLISTRHTDDDGAQVARSPKRIGVCCVGERQAGKSRNVFY